MSHSVNANVGQAIAILQTGSSGPEVIDLQYILALRGGNHEFDPGSIDGVFGNRTREAVIKFQHSQKLVEDGIVGSHTWSAMKSQWATQPGIFLKKGDTGDVITKLQKALASKGFNPGAMDGSFGSKTQAALIKFQKTGKPVSNTVGVVGPLTWGGLTGG